MDQPPRPGIAAERAQHRVDQLAGRTLDVIEDRTVGRRHGRGGLAVSEGQGAGLEQANLAQALIKEIIGAHGLRIFVGVLRRGAAGQGLDHIVRPVVQEEGHGIA